MAFEPEKIPSERAERLSFSDKREEDQLEYTKEDERRAVRKLDWTLIPLVGFIYLLSYIDRGNIGNAYAAGMKTSLHLSSNDYSWLVTILYISYIFGQMLIMVWSVANLPLWVALMVFGWGAMSMLQAATDNWTGLMAIRFLIGIFEAGFVPGVALYLSFFYHRREMGLRYGLFISFSPLASCFASAMAYGIVRAKTAVANWKLLFLVEGAPTIIMAFIAFWFLPNGPGLCRSLSDFENKIVASRARKARGEDSVEKKLDIKQALSAFTDYKNYLQAIIIFCLNTSFAALPAYLPTIIEEIGIGNPLQSQGLSAPPYLAAYLVCVFLSFASDKANNRGYFITALCCVGGAGYIILNQVLTPGVRYFATFLVCAGVFPAVALTFTWVTDNQGSSSKRGAGLVIFGMIGQCGPILGARLYPTNEAPLYRKGMAVNAGVLFFAAAATILLSVCLGLENRRKDKEHGGVPLEYVPVDVADLGDAHPMYRFIK